MFFKIIRPLIKENNIMTEKFNQAVNPGFHSLIKPEGGWL